ncbi:MAG: hypothetical protein LBG94_02385 [Treponema sp.]|jgi:hypothetical protein|nr:hypothetical protein [Treponema sp.]
MDRRILSAKAGSNHRFLINSFFFFLFFYAVSFSIYAQSRDNSQAAQQYVIWIQQAIDEQRWNDAAAALVRASDYDTVSSDISYLNAVTNNYFGADRNLIISNLNNAAETNRWVTYSQNHALILKTEMQIALRDYRGAVATLDRMGEAALSVQMKEDCAMLRLLALRGMLSGFASGYNAGQAQAQFRSLVLQAMDSFPRDPRPLRIFFEYARNRTPGQNTQMPESDINLLELTVRRLPFLLEADPELAWMAAPFIRDIDAARRLLASYRAGGIPNIQNRDFMPHPGSIPAALNLGLIDDIRAVEELFSGSRGFNNPLPALTGDNIRNFAFGNPVIAKNIIIETYNLLGSEEGRNLFTEKLLSFTGIITCDEDNDGYIDSSAYYHSGIIRHFSHDRDQNNVYDLAIDFDSNGVPDSARFFISDDPVIISWERYPSVKQLTLGSPGESIRATDYNYISSNKTLSGNYEIFTFGPADFQYAPVIFSELGGSRTMAGLKYPEPAFQYINLTYRSLITFCSGITRPSREIDGAVETIYLNRGVLLQAVEILDGRQISVTEFERGFPVSQHIDLDLDGRLETIRLFRRPPQDYVWQDFLDYRRLVASSESDWHGNGRFKTMEVYQNDGSVVYYFDTDGGGVYNFSETRKSNE